MLCQVKQSGVQLKHAADFESFDPLEVARAAGIDRPVLGES